MNFLIMSTLSLAWVGKEYSNISYPLSKASIIHISAYIHDPSILAWETGNELYYPTLSWTIELARHIKQEIGAQQLVMDGKIISRETNNRKF